MALRSTGLARAAASAAAGVARTFDLASLRGRHFPHLFALTPAEIDGLLGLSAALKAAYTQPAPGVDPWAWQPARGRTMSMIFQKRSTRTRVSTETGFARLGGHALFLGSEDIQLGKNETLEDTARVLSGYNDLILARVFGHDVIDGLCATASVPVINALSDQHHPLQGLADLLTLQEHFGRLAGLRIAWVGDGNNIAHTLLSAAGAMGYHMAVATPKGYECDAGIVATSVARADPSGVKLTFGHDPVAAVAGADVIVTDTWVSMGQEAEAKRRLADFAGYQVTEALAAKGGAAPHWVFLHCLPRKPQEVDDEVFYSPKRSLVFPEAENRMWTVMAVSLALLHGRVEGVPAAAVGRAGSRSPHLA